MLVLTTILGLQHCSQTAMHFWIVILLLWEGVLISHGMHWRWYVPVPPVVVPPVPVPPVPVVPCQELKSPLHCLCSSASFTCSATCISWRICNTSLHYVTFLQCAVLDNAGYSVEKCWRFCLLLIRGWTYHWGSAVSSVKCKILQCWRFCLLPISLQCALCRIQCWGVQKILPAPNTRLDLSSRKCSV